MAFNVRRRDNCGYRICVLVIRRCVKRHSRLPSTIVVDHGSDFISSHFDRVNKRLRPNSHPRFDSVMSSFSVFAVRHRRRKA